MRVFTFFLMMAVAVGGALGGYKLITGKDLVSPSDFGIARAEKAQTDASPARSVEPTPVPTAIVVPTPAPTATPVPEKPTVLAVGNTEGQGVYVRRTPNMADRLKVWPDGARMEILRKGIQGDGRTWARVRAPDGAEGYVPEQFLVPPR